MNNMLLYIGMLSICVGILSIWIAIFYMRLQALSAKMLLINEECVKDVHNTNETFIDYEANIEDIHDEIDGLDQDNTFNYQLLISIIHKLFLKCFCMDSNQLIQAIYDCEDQAREALMDQEKDDEKDLEDYLSPESILPGGIAQLIKDSRIMDQDGKTYMIIYYKHGVYPSDSFIKQSEKIAKSLNLDGVRVLEK